MFAAADDIETKFSNMPKTWGQIWIGMKNKALSIFNPILNKVNQVANSEKFTQVTNGVINGLAGIASVATVVLDLLIGGAALVVDNWSWLAPIAVSYTHLRHYRPRIPQGAIYNRCPLHNLIQQAPRQLLGGLAAKPVQIRHHQEIQLEPWKGYA